MVEMDENGNWPEIEDWPSIQAWVTCRTAGCPVEGVAFEATLMENPQPYEKYRAWCGRCHTANEEIVEIASTKTRAQNVKAHVRQNGKVVK